MRSDLTSRLKIRAHSADERIAMPLPAFLAVVRSTPEQLRLEGIMTRAEATIARMKHCARFHSGSLEQLVAAHNTPMSRLAQLGCTEDLERIIDARR
jgi:uncharacterized pyridoxal phosphate-containing UPF0001 family protein